MPQPSIVHHAWFHHAMIRDDILLQKIEFVSGGFYNSVQKNEKMEYIDGELDHNNCYRPSKHPGGGLIAVN